MLSFQYHRENFEGHSVSSWSGLCSICRLTFLRSCFDLYILSPEMLSAESAFSQQALSKMTNDRNVPNAQKHIKQTDPQTVSGVTILYSLCSIMQCIQIKKIQILQILTEFMDKIIYIYIIEYRCRNQSSPVLPNSFSFVISHSALNAALKALLRVHETTI